MKDDIHRPAKNIRQTKETEKLKEKLEVTKDKRRINQKLRYSKTCVKLVFKINSHLMQVKSIAECSKGSILQYFRPAVSYCLLLRYLFCLFMSGSFTQILLYVHNFILSAIDLTIYIYHVVSSFSKFPTRDGYTKLTVLHLLAFFSKQSGNNCDDPTQHSLLNLLFMDVHARLHPL